MADEEIIVSESNEELIKVEDVLSPMSTFQDVVSYRQSLNRLPTPARYIKMKDKFPYLPSKYVDDIFKKWFPISNQDVLSREDKDGWIHYTVKVTVAFPNGIVIGQVGAGAARKQLKTSARIKIEGDPNAKPPIPPDPDYKITIYDYVDNGNTEKAALTLAIKNAQERFGVGADITERLILSEEEIKETAELIEQTMLKITNPRERLEWKNKLAMYDTPNKKVKFLIELEETFPDIIAELRTNQNK